MRDYRIVSPTELAELDAEIDQLRERIAVLEAELKAAQERSSYRPLVESLEEVVAKQRAELETAQKQVTALEGVYCRRNGAGGGGIMARGNWNKHHSGDICDATPDTTRAGLVARSHELYAVSTSLVVALEAIVHALPTGEGWDFCSELDLAEAALEKSKTAGVPVEA